MSNSRLDAISIACDVCQMRLMARASPGAFALYASVVELYHALK